MSGRSISPRPLGEEDRAQRGGVGGTELADGHGAAPSVRFAATSPRGEGEGRRLAACAALGLVLSSMPAVAEIKDYQIRRMLMLKTECGVEGLDVRKVTGNGEGFTDLFVAACENVAHYPDGVEVLCPDTEDERDCRMLTRKREFQHLHLLKP